MSINLPTVFTLAQARERGWSKDAIYRKVKSGQLERLGYGVFILPEAVDPSLRTLAGATAAQPTATLCLASALIRHGLSDAILPYADIALPRGVRHPAGFEYVTWHSFEAGSYGIGRERIVCADLMLFAYSAERTIIDCYRLAHREGIDVANTALRRWLRQPGNSPAHLLAMAKMFPRTLPRIRNALEVLL